MIEPDFRDRYRQAFEALGRPLLPEDGIPDDLIDAAARRLGVMVPRALADFYRVAGRADDYTSAFNRLLPPEEWTLQDGTLVFLEENQAVVLWGIAATPNPGDDPPALQATNEPPLAWEQVGEHCSTFLLVMLHWEAAFASAMPCAGTAIAPGDLATTLDRNWSFVGEAADIRAYSAPGRAACLAPWDDGYELFVGTTDEADLDAIARELGISLEELPD